MADPLRFGIVGTGHMARTMAHCMRAMPGIVIAGFLSRDPARAREIGTAYGALTAYDTLEAMLADPLIDAVYVAHESAAHARVSIQALEAGKAVLCEKPCALDAAGARAIADAAERSGKLFMEAIATPFLPAIAMALQAASGGQLGTLRHMAADFGYPATPASFPACYAPEGGGVLLDRAVYPVALALLALGPVADIEARVMRDAGGIDVEASIMLGHEDGAVSMLGASFLCELGNDMTIAGTRGSAMVESPLLAAERCAITLHGDVVRQGPPDGALVSRLKQSGFLRRGKTVLRAAAGRHLSYGLSPYWHEVEHFRDLLRAGARQSPVLPPSRSIEILTVLDAVRAKTS